MANTQNLRCRNGAYLFRRKVPLRLLDRMAWICTEALFSAVDRAPTTFSLGEIKARVRAELDRWIEEGEAKLACGETMAGLWPGAPDDRAYADLADRACTALARNDLAQATAVVASGAVTGIDPEALDERTEKLVCHAVLRAQHEFWTQIHRRSEGDYPPLAQGLTERRPLATDLLVLAPDAAANPSGPPFQVRGGEHPQPEPPTTT